MGHRKDRKIIPSEHYLHQGKTSERVDFTLSLQSFFFFFKALDNSDQDQQTVEQDRWGSNPS